MVLTLRGGGNADVEALQTLSCPSLKTIYLGFLGFYTVLNPGLTAVNEILKGRQKSGLSPPFFLFVRTRSKLNISIFKPQETPSRVCLRAIMRN